MTDKQRVSLMTALKTSGVFVTCGLDKPNVMSAHWGSIGNFWNRPVFTLAVRTSKFSHELISQSKCFALSVPVKDMRNEIIQCDHISGYNTNKFYELNLHPSRAKTIPTYVISECGLFFECNVLFSADMTKEQIDYNLWEEMYHEKDLHTMYFAEIVEAYEK